MPKIISNIQNYGLNIHQPDTGHRFSMDSILLAQSIIPKNKSRILDLGCGCGVISMIIARNFPDIYVIGVEIQQSIVEIAKKNVRANDLSGQVRIDHKDIRMIKGNDYERFQYIVCNPPFRKKYSGRPNHASEKMIAREETTCNLSDILDVSRKLLVNQGELSLIYPSERICDVLLEMNMKNITPKSLIPIYTKPEHPAKWGIVKGRLNAQSGLVIHEGVLAYNAKASFMLNTISTNM